MKKKKKLHEVKIAVVIPYYNASNSIAAVVAKIPGYISTIIIVDDKSVQPLPAEQIRKVVNSATELVLLHNEVNLGVGGATKRGFEYALQTGVDIVIKIDADDQMDVDYIPQLLQPLLSDKAEMSKGNRFRDINALKKMPVVRRTGNLILSFLTKMATGYWNNFDPNNGFLAIKTSILSQIEIQKLDNRYFFETSLIGQLYFIRARIKDVPMPAIYGDEVSSMRVWTMPVVFSNRLIRIFFKRILKEYFLYDFNIASLYLLTGIPLFLFGIIFGIWEWVYYYTSNLAAPTGTIMIVALSIILGFQLLLQAIQYDIFHSPKAK